MTSERKERVDISKSQTRLKELVADLLSSKISRKKFNIQKDKLPNQYKLVYWAEKFKFKQK